jgi:membrane protease subunit HflC
MKLKSTILLVILGLVIVGVSQSLFTVDETEQAIVLQLGKPKGDVKGPGLHFKIPVVQEVRYFDRRILSVDPEPEQMVVSSIGHDFVGNVRQDSEEEGVIVSGEPIIVDTFARYRISDPLQFMKTLRTTYHANQRLESIMDEATRSVLGNIALGELLSEERTTIMNDIAKRVNNKMEEASLGIEIVDIRIVRADLTPELRHSTVRRMISELLERATETRAKGEEQALEISSTAEKEREIILANAERDAQITRGQGDNEAIKTYAKAFNKDKDFYSFIRTMEAYRSSLANPETRFILSPDSQFFRYFSPENSK